MASSLFKPLSNSLFSYEFTTRIHDIDAAGVLFFARSLYHAHDAYEAFLNYHKQSIAAMLESDFILPINHSEADFKAPVFLNEIINIELFCHEIKENEFSLSYQFLDNHNKIRLTSLTRHICLDSSTRKRKKLPESIHSILTTHNNC